METTEIVHNGPWPSESPKHAAGSEQLGNIYMFVYSPLIVNYLSAVICQCLHN